MKRLMIVFAAIFAMAAPSIAQAPVRGDWVPCPNLLETAGVCVSGEAVLVLVTPVQHAVLARDAVCGVRGYQATVDDGNGNQIPNPESCKQFAIKEIYRILKAYHAQFTASEAAQAAAQQALLDAQNELGEVVPDP